MSSSSNKTIAKNTIFLYFRMMLTMVISLYTSRVILQVLGVDDYGIYQAVGGIVGFLSFLNNALSTGSSRFITFGLGENNLQKLKNIFSTTYGREDIIAKAIKDLKIERNQIYLTTRVSNKSQFQGNVRETALRSIERFNVEYVDLLMFHWPVPEKYISTWEELIKLQEDGICKNIGVANCHQHHLEKIIAETSVKPQVNQVEIHPLLSQKNLIEYCQSQNIQMEAYTSLARMDERIVRLPVMKDLTKKYQKSISQLILRWHIQNGVIPIFRSFNENRQRENFSVFDFVKIIGIYCVLVGHYVYFMDVPFKLSDFIPLKSNRIVLELSDGIISTLASHKIILFCLSKVFCSDNFFAMIFCSVFVLLITWLLIIVCKKKFPSLLGYRNAKIKKIME